MSPKKAKRKHQKSGNNVKISPENKKQKSLLHYVDCDKEEITSSMAEMLDHPTLSSNQETPTKSVIEAKLDEILEKIKPIEEIRKNVTDLTNKISKLETTAKDHESRLQGIENSAEMYDKTFQSVQADLQRLDEESKARSGKYDMNSLWRAKCESLEESVNKMEAYSRRDNIVFEGLSESEGENCHDIIYKLLVERLSIQDARERIHFTSLHRIGKKRYR